MDFIKVKADVDKNSDLLTGVREDGLDDAKQRFDPLQFVEVKTEIKVSYCFFFLFVSFTL
jgi:hypothetical protein